MSRPVDTSADRRSPAAGDGEPVRPTGAAGEWRPPAVTPAEGRLFAWLRAVVAGREAGLGALADEFADLLVCARLEDLAAHYGATHPTLVARQRDAFVYATAVEHAAAACVARLAAAAVPCVTLKGPALAARYWPGAARASVDVDLLVAPRDFARAREALAEEGLTAWHETMPEWYARRWFYSLPLTSDRPGPTVDLHWAVLRPGIGRLDAAELIGAGEEVAVGDRRLPAPSPPWELVVCAAHAAHEVFPLRALLDVAFVGRALSPDEWRGAADVAARAGLGPTLAYAAWQSGRRVGWRPAAAATALQPRGRRDRLARRYLEALPAVGPPSRATLQVQHVMTPLLSCSGAGCMRALPAAMLTDRAGSALVLDRLARRVSRRRRP